MPEIWSAKLRAPACVLADPIAQRRHRPFPERKPCLTPLWRAARWWTGRFACRRHRSGSDRGHAGGAARTIRAAGACRQASLDGDIPLGAGRALLKPMGLANLIRRRPRLSATDRVLDVICGTGYSSAVLSRLANAVVALEENAALARRAQEACRRALRRRTSRWPVGLTAGWPAGAPYDVHSAQRINRNCAGNPRAPVEAGGPDGLRSRSNSNRQGQIYRIIEGHLVGRPMFDAAARSCRALPPLRLSCSRGGRGARPYSAYCVCGGCRLRAARLPLRVVFPPKPRITASLPLWLRNFYQRFCISSPDAGFRPPRQPLNVASSVLPTKLAGRKVMARLRWGSAAQRGERR